MAARPPVQVTRNREKEAWELRQRFWTEQRIADHLGIERSTVSKMLDRVERRLAEQLAAAALPIKSRQTAQLEHVASEAYEAWERSKLEAELERVVTAETSVVGGALGDDGPVEVTLPAVETRTTNERKGQTGDPAHLNTAMKALADIREIWGLDAPKKNEHSGPGGGPIEFAHAATTFDYRLSALAAAYGEGGAGLESLGGDEGRPALPVGAMGETEPTSAGWGLADVAGSGGQRVREDEDGSGVGESPDRERPVPEDGSGSADGG